jgi:hypothetical protein
MAFTLHRLDAIYTAPFVAPALTLIGQIPDIILKAYRAFADRYPFIRPDAFRALGSNTLSEVGVSIVLLENRLEITLRVDQFVIRATNLRNPHEIRFVQDCAFLMHEFITNQLPETTIGTVNLHTANWLLLDGGKEEVSKILARVAKPSRPLFEKKCLDAEDIEYWPKLLLKNQNAGWQLTVGVEPSVIPDANLYIMREYMFDQASALDTPEKKVGFLESSGIAICGWLGIEPAPEVL